VPCSGKYKFTLVDGKAREVTTSEVITNVFITLTNLYNFLYSPAFSTCEIPQASKRTVLFHDSSMYKVKIGAAIKNNWKASVAVLLVRM
jgi:nitroimidazol reductase NimA-like FMN-containing flavoprotein (pyridoxamine 5'-phosphate oxidase superfamily)